eukprot:1159519-Pelagomonas_calceolata.AAC.2
MGMGRSCAGAQRLARCCTAPKTRSHPAAARHSLSGVLECACFSYFLQHNSHAQCFMPLLLWDVVGREDAPCCALLGAQRASALLLGVAAGELTDAIAQLCNCLEWLQGGRTDAFAQLHSCLEWLQGEHTDAFAQVRSSSAWLQGERADAIAAELHA